jgi:hypothetical protein
MIDSHQEQEEEEEEITITDEELAPIIGGRVTASSLIGGAARTWLYESGKRRLTPSDTTPLL